MNLILQHCDAAWPETKGLLKRYVSFPSISTDPAFQADVRRCAEWLSDHCEKIGLVSRLQDTTGNPVVLARTTDWHRSAKPHVLVYGHYDVQPPGAEEEWGTPAFQTHERDGRIYGRGTSDNKGQTLAHIQAVASWLSVTGALPCEVCFVIEGEEETGSPSFRGFLNEHQNELASDLVVISDTNMPDLDHPALTVSLRGLISLEVTLARPGKELHSGIYGGAVDNPAVRLCEMIGSLVSPEGRIRIEGFYDKICENEDASLATAPFDTEKFFSDAGMKVPLNADARQILSAVTQQPTFEINSLTSGYQGRGIKTSIPTSATAKISFRLVPDQEPAVLLKSLQDHLRKRCPAGMTLSMIEGFNAKPYAFPKTSCWGLAAEIALEKGFGRKPIRRREGVTIPVVPWLHESLNVDSLLIGFALPQDNMHGPNESISVEAMQAGIRTSVYLWELLGKINQTNCETFTI